MEGEKKILYEQPRIIEPDKDESMDKKIETQELSLTRKLIDDPRFQSIKDELIADWERQNGNRWNGNELRSEFQDYMFGDPTAFKKHEKPVTLDDRAENLFREKFSEVAQMYDAREEKRIYDNPIDDPAVQNLENEILRKTNADSGVRQALEKPTLQFNEVWNRTYEANSIHMWNEFASQYPEKAKTYKEFIQSIPRTSSEEELAEYEEKTNEGSPLSRVDRFGGVQEQLPLTPEQLRELRLEQVLEFNKLEIPEKIEYYAAMVEKAESKGFGTHEMDQILQNIAIDSRSDELNLIYLSGTLKKIDREEHNAIMENVELLPQVQNILFEAKKVDKRLDGMVSEEDIQDDSNVDVKRYFTLKHMIRDCKQNIKNVFFFKEVLSRIKVEIPKKEKLYMDVINNRVVDAVQNSADIWRRLLAVEKELMQSGITISTDPEIGLKEWREKMEKQAPKDPLYKPESLDAMNRFILLVRNGMTREELASFEDSMRGREGDATAYIDGIVKHVLKNIPTFKDILVDFIKYQKNHPQGKKYLYDPIRKGAITLKNGKLCVQKDAGGIEFLTE